MFSVVENGDLPSGNRKQRSRRVAMIALLLGLLFVLAIAAVGCGIPGRIRRALGIVTPVSPAQTLPWEDATPSPLPLQVPIEEATSDAPSFTFAVLNAVPEDRANVGGVDEIRTAFRKLKELGISVVGQAFAAESTRDDWQAYLDVAAQENIKVAGWFRDTPPVWTGSSFDLGVNRVFLEAMKDHPALYAFLLIDEPFHKKHGWEITVERLQLLYQQAKQIAPRVLMAVQFSREVEKAEARQDPRFAFKRGMCDVCIISTLEFRNYGEGNLFYRDVLLATHSVSRAVIRREDPEAKIWTTVQVFGSSTGDSSYYMPRADELQQMVDLLLSPELRAAGALDGMLWQQWASFYAAKNSEQYTLSDPEFEELRNIVRDTARRLNLLDAP